MTRSTFPGQNLESTPNRTTFGSSDVEKVHAVVARSTFPSRDPGPCLALRTQQKGGKSLTYLTTELGRFIVHCGHTEAALRCDSEPSTLSLLDSVKRACAGMRIVVHSEPSPTGDHQSNGAAKAMVGVLRQSVKN